VSSLIHNDKVIVFKSHFYVITYIIIDHEPSKIVKGSK